MFGFVIGTACLVGLVMTLRRGRFACGMRHHSPFGGYGFGGPGFGGPGFRGPGFRGHRAGRRFFFSHLFDGLDTTPAQEKVILGAFDELQDIVAAHRGEVRKSRDDVAAAVRSPSFDETRLGELFARHDGVIEALRKAGVGAIARIHAVLDDRQRERFAELIETGPRAFRRGWSERGWRGYRGDLHGSDWS